MPGTRLTYRVACDVKVWLLARQEVHTFEWTMFVHVYECTSLYLDTEAMQLVPNQMVSL